MEASAWASGKRMPMRSKKGRSLRGEPPGKEKGEKEQDGGRASDGSSDLTPLKGEGERGRLRQEMPQPASQL